MARTGCVAQIYTAGSSAAVGFIRQAANGEFVALALLKRRR
jgi:hypothetical protein